MRLKGIANPKVKVYSVKVEPSDSMNPSSSAVEFPLLPEFPEGHIMLHVFFPSILGIVVE